MMNNDQIRLSLLCQYYRAKFNGKHYGHREENPELKDVDPAVREANLSYLVDKSLINGSKTYTNDGVFVSTSDISAWGMDIVEQILDKSLEKIDQGISTEIKKESTTHQKLDKFYEICVKAEPMCEIAVKIAGAIFSGL